MIFLNLYHFRLKWQQVAQGGSGWHSQNAVPHGVLTVILHPDGRARRQCAARSPERYLPIRPLTDFYVHLNIARYVFSNSKWFE